MDVKTHWEKVYQTKAPDAVSWYKPHLETSLALIECTRATPSSAIIDVGAGESTLADDLLALEFKNITAVGRSVATISGLLLTLNPRGSLSSPTMNASSSASPDLSSRTGPATALDRPKSDRKTSPCTLGEVFCAARIHGPRLIAK